MANIEYRTGTIPKVTKITGLYRSSGLKRLRETIGSETMLLLLSFPDAMEYYPRLGFKKVENGFYIPRER